MEESKPSPIKEKPWEVFSDEAAELVEKLAHDGQAGGLLRVGIDLSAPAGLVESWEKLWQHISGRHAKTCTCSFRKLVIVYVRRSIEDDKDTALNAWVRRTLRGLRSAGMVPIAIAWDSDCKGWQFGKDRAGFWRAVEALGSRDVVAICSAAGSRISRCKRCGPLVAWRLRDAGKLIGYGDDFDTMELKDIAVPRDCYEITRTFALAESENTARGRAVKGVFDGMHRKGYAKQECKTPFYGTRRMEEKETKDRNWKDLTPWAYCRLPDATDFGQRLLVGLRASPTIGTLRGFARSRKVSLDKLVQWVNDEIITGFENDGEIKLPQLVIYSREEYEAVRELVQQALLGRKARRISRRKEIETEYTQEKLEAACQDAHGPHCTKRAHHGGVCGYPTKCVTPSDPHHRGKDIEVCLNPQAPHQRQFPDPSLEKVLAWKALRADAESKASTGALDNGAVQDAAPGPPTVPETSGAPDDGTSTNAQEGGGQGQRHLPGFE